MADARSLQRSETICVLKNSSNIRLRNGGTFICARKVLGVFVENIVTHRVFFLLIFFRFFFVLCIFNCHADKIVHGIKLRLVHCGNYFFDGGIFINFIIFIFGFFFFRFILIFFIVFVCMSKLDFFICIDLNRIGIITMTQNFVNQRTRICSGKNKTHFLNNSVGNTIGCLLNVVCKNRNRINITMSNLHLCFLSICSVVEFCIASHALIMVFKNYVPKNVGYTVVLVIPDKGNFASIIVFECAMQNSISVSARGVVFRNPC